MPEKPARKQIIQRLLDKEQHSLSEENIDEIGGKTDGYSGADMANLCREAAMGPIRSIDKSLIETGEIDTLRPINEEDFVCALRQVKASVSNQDLEQYEVWNNKYGAGQ